MSTHPPHNPDEQDPFSDEFQHDPFVDDHFSSRGGSGSGGGSFSDMGVLSIPEANSVLVLGIISIVGAFCYGIFGIILGVIALIVANKPMKAYKQEPGKYTLSSYNNLKTGRVCAIIGLSISAVYIVVILGIVMFAIANS